MTRYRYFTASTLDGFLADDEHSLAWLFKHDIDENGPGSTAAFLVDVGAQVMGSSTYMWVLEHDREWLPEIPTFVFTHRSLEAANEHVSFVAGDPVDHRGALESAAGGRDVCVMGVVASRQNSRGPGCSPRRWSRSRPRPSVQGSRCSAVPSISNSRGASGTVTSWWSGTTSRGH